MIPGSVPRALSMGPLAPRTFQNAMMLFRNEWPDPTWFERTKKGFTDVL